MARPLRIEVAGALYHVTGQSEGGRAIYDDDGDRALFLDVLGEVVGERAWRCFAYCLLDDRYHLLIETPAADLSKGMRQLGGVYTQAANRRHGRTGRLFRGRFAALVAEADAYLLELAREVVLSPVRAGLVEDPAEWIWSSHLAVSGTVRAPPWLAADALLARFAGNPAEAVRRYRRFVGEATRRETVLARRRRQIFLGDDAFVARMLAQSEEAGRAHPAASAPPPAPSLAEIAARHPRRDAAIVAAHATGAYSYQQIAEAFGLHFTSVGRIVRAARSKRRTAPP